MPKKKTKLDDWIPLDTIPYNILAILFLKELHGYGIKLKIVEDYKYTPGMATLYRNLKNLQDAGLIEDAGKTDTSVSGIPRQYYRITQPGRDIFQLERSRRAEEYSKTSRLQEEVIANTR